MPYAPAEPAETDRQAREPVRSRRWEFWRSPGGQPGWARPALLAIAAVAALLYSRNIGHAGLSPFYAVAVKSMSESWKAFIFGAFDPKATISLDKLAGSFLPQALSARVFGFHAWSLALPQVIEGVVSVLVLHRAVRRWAGPVPGLLAAAIFAITPIAASMFGHSMEDGALTMCLVLAADCYQRAVGEARLRSLAWCGFWVGAGFQAKMLQAWIVLPALAAGYLLAAPAPLRRRLGQLMVAGTIMLAVSLSWIALYTFTPAGDRPYVDGSTDNSAAAMVFGYNGLERFGVNYPGSVVSMSGGHGGYPGSGLPEHAGMEGGPQAVAASAALRAALDHRSGEGWTKLLGSKFGPEIGWLYPLALITLGIGLLWRRRADRTDRARAGFVMWGVWLCTFGLIFSKMKVIPHTAYVASLAPPIAALSGAGIVLLWKAYRSGGRLAWALPVTVACELAWSGYLWASYRTFLPEVWWMAGFTGLAGIGVMVAARLSQRARARLLLPGMVAGVVAMLAAPAAWAGSVLDARYAGSSMNANAGPQPPSWFGGGTRSSAATLTRLGIGGHRQGDQNLGSLTGAQRRIYSYVSAHRDGAGYLMAVESWTQAAPYIVATGQEVMPMGGFSGTVPDPTLAHVRHLVHIGQLRYFLLDPPASTAKPAPWVMPMHRMGEPGGAALRIAAWVRQACAWVPASDYGGVANIRATPMLAGPATLFSCNGRQRSPGAMASASSGRGTRTSAPPRRR